LIDITQALGAGWEATSVASEADAAEQLEKSAFDAFLADFNLGSPDASELLNQALEKRPETPRFLFAYESDLALVAAKVNGAHHILPKPIEPDSLKKRIEDGIGDANSKQAGSDPSNSPIDAPAVSSIYSEVLKAMESPGATSEQVGEMIARDEALTSEVLRLTNSAYLGLPRNITEPAEAVEALGLETVKALVMALQFLAEHSRLRPGYLSLDEIWQHSVNVAQIARDLVLFETKDRKLASQALIAGLLHDLGKVVLVTNFDDLYGRVHSLANKQPVSLWDIEKGMFGANHGEIGACLVGMWNMPGPIVDAAALHHEPPLGEQQQMTPLAAVHIANVLEHQLRPSDDGMMVAPIMNTPFLNELGLLERLPVWRAAFANRRPENPQQEDESAELDASGSPVTKTSRPASYQPRRRDGIPALQAVRNLKHWIYGGIGAGALALLVIWLTRQPEINNPEPVYAQTRAPQQAAVVPEVAPAAAPEASPTAAVSDEPPTPSTPAATQTASLPNTKESAQATEPAIATSTNSATASVPTASVPPPVAVVPPAVPQEKPQQQYKLTGIIFTSRPSAIVNGVNLNVGEQVDGATVVAIGRTAVTLQFNGQRKTYLLR
jgi:HD-like signal output (HDOD) protein